MTTQEHYDNIAALAKRLVEECTRRRIKLSTAESCTGGMLSAAVTSVPGSSAVIELGICSYSNRIKCGVLGVGSEIIREYTEYSVQCAAAMADGVRRLSGSDISASVTGVAGPDGGTPSHPVGEVCIGVSGKNGSRAERFLFAQGTPERENIRAAAAEKALELLLAEITD